MNFSYLLQLLPGALDSKIASGSSQARAPEVIVEPIGFSEACFLKRSAIDIASSVRSALRRQFRYRQSSCARAISAAVRPREIHRAQESFIAKNFVGKLVVVPD
ncbi:hypothetical protein [Sinorhizobium fredii]|uniref:hypothetical protein n=1 Tax=Rhizobium fredii TaxID=380 RepID=UPI00339AAC15